MKMNKVTAALLCVVVMGGVVIMVAGVYMRRSSTASHITIETKHISTLAPHEHHETDAVSDVGHHEEVISSEFVVPDNVMITAIHFEIVGAPRSVLHHAALVSLGCIPKDECPTVTHDLVRYGQDTMYDMSGAFPNGYALRVHRGERLRLSAMVHNPEHPIGPGGTYRDVYGRMTLDLAAPGAQNTPVRFVMLSLGGTCENGKPNSDEPFTFTIPPQKRDFVFSGCGNGPESGIYRFTAPGTIVHMGAHLHGWQGGKELVVNKNGTEMYRFTTTRAPEDKYRYDTHHADDFVSVAAGDVFSIQAVYDNEYSVATRGAMGMLGIYLADQTAAK